VTSETTSVNNPDGTTESTTTNNGSEEVPDSSIEGNCGADGQPACAIDLGTSEELINGIPADYGLRNFFINPNGVLATELDKMDGIVTPLEDMPDNFLEPLNVNFTMSGGTDCDGSAYSSEYKGSNFPILSGFCQVHDYAIRPALYYFFGGLTLISIIRIFNRASRSL